MIMDFISKEFLDEALDKKVAYFEVTPGCNPWDGYTSTLLSIEVTMEGPPKEGKESNNSHVILKCFPSQIGRHEYLQMSNIFHRELSMYTVFLPELQRFQKTILKNESDLIQPLFPEIVSGRSVDYSVFRHGEYPTSSDSLCNYIILPDLRKADLGGFHLVDRLVCLDFQHLKLVIAAQAKFHALSWAYKQKNGIPNLPTKFPFLKGSIFDDSKEEQTLAVLHNAISLFTAVLEKVMPDTVERTNLVGSLQRAQEKLLDIVALYCSDKRKVSSSSVTKDNILRIPPQQDEKMNKESWLVAVHGDTKSSNMLFRYDPNTRKPLEVKFIDLQYSREGDPMTDINYTVFTATDSKFRKKHMGEILQIYTATFIDICARLGVDTPKGFDLAEVTWEFERARSFGFIMTLIGFPFFLAEYESENAKPNLEKMEPGVTSEDANLRIKNMTKGILHNRRFQERVVDVTRELYEAGVI